MSVDDAATRAAELARELSSPVRIAIVRHLADEGPVRAGELARSLGLPEPLVSNHLRRLREKRYIDVDRQGRSASYHLTDPRITEIVFSLLVASGTSPNIRETSIEASRELTFARSCYDHIAGELGVRMCAAFLDRHALERTADDDIELGPHAEEVFAALGAGMTALPRRRKLAVLCPDWSHGDAHLGGALGAAVLTGLLSRDWIRSVDGSRRLDLSPAGRKGLAALLSD